MRVTAEALFQIEREHRARGMARLAGVDEAGRGPLAGPVVAAAVVLPEEWFSTGLPDSLAGLNDSKQVNEGDRKRWFGVLTSGQGIEFGVGIVTAEEVDRVNILQATHQAMREALAGLEPRADHALVDGRPVPMLGTQQTALVKGDSRSYSIAAASIVAKVTRDRMMLEFHERWPMYGFAGHKGYGTAAHLAAIAAHGPCPIHRRTFAPLRAEQQELL
ncbi:MAG: ribonuclease HII [Verrucomicrobiota bacterium]|nr:ribonuclease HII [Verrucomicrobiota bacterium]